MGKKTKKEPLKNLTDDQLDRIVREKGRAKILINQIRLSLANAYNSSILDQIMDVDGKIGTITEENVQRFISNFAACCYPYMEDYPLCTRRAFMMGSPIEDLKISNYQIYLRNIFGVIVLDRILYRTGLITNWPYEDYLLEHLDDEDYPEEKNPTEYKLEKQTYLQILSKETNLLKLDITDPKIDELRNELLFSNVLKSFENYIVDAALNYSVNPYDFFSPYTDRKKNELDIPFLSTYKSCYDYALSQYGRFPAIPPLMCESVINGIETYSFYFGLSTNFSTKKGKLIANENYTDIIDGLNDIIDLIFEQNESKSGD